VNAVSEAHVTEPRGTLSRKTRMRGGPIAIVDIGSNSVRLVIYESLSRIPAVVHNEKAICAIGRDMVSTGQLHREGMQLALEALSRFRMLSDAHRVPLREAVATAAARDAANGQDFIRQAEVAWAGAIRVLSGEEEARLAAEGVLAGIPSADGLVADLGGGSLDMVSVKDGLTGAPMTLPIGPLRLMDVARGDADRARDIVDEGLEKLKKLGSLKGRSLYAVGGVWRSFARLEMENAEYPLHVLHNYRFPASRALKLCKLLAHQSRRSLDKMRGVSRRRAEALPFGAVVLERLLLAGELKDVVVSAYGLREGLLFAHLTEEERAKDPLIAFAAAMNERISRVPSHAEELFRWSSPLFVDETSEMRRIRQAICLFSDVGWRRHPDERALGAFNQVLTAPFAGAGHRARAIIATAVFHRYSGDGEQAREMDVKTLLSEDDANTALRIGLVVRLGFALTASAVGELLHYCLRMTPTRVVLEISRKREMIAGEPVQKRLGEVAAAFGRKGEIHIA
jgi:exopolyphosphatase / guanosine-5'-triphosphate,3'-diphosphate pyrophosphatase